MSIRSTCSTMNAECSIIYIRHAFDSATLLFIAFYICNITKITYSDGLVTIIIDKNKNSVNFRTVSSVLHIYDYFYRQFDSDIS